jgi:hypothetical protein
MKGPSRVALVLLLVCASHAIKIGGSRKDEADGSPPLGRHRDAGSASAVRRSEGADVSPSHGEASVPAPEGEKGKRLVVVGSLNLDVIVQVDRLPQQGENVVARSPDASTALGGKVSAARVEPRSFLGPSERMRTHAFREAHV